MHSHKLCTWYDTSLNDLNSSSTISMEQDMESSTDYIGIIAEKFWWTSTFTDMPIRYIDLYNSVHLK